MADRIGKPPVPVPLLIAGKLALAGCWAFPLAERWGWFAPWYDHAVARSAGIVLYVAGAALAAVSFVSLGGSLAVGLPESDTELKTGGAYRLSRNPLYVAAYAICTGSCLVAPHPVSLALFAAAALVHHRIILSEERFLEARFGPLYLEYKRRVPRYLGVRSGHHR